MIQNGIIINGEVYELVDVSKDIPSYKECLTCDIKEICFKTNIAICDRFFKTPFGKAFKRRENVTIKTNDDEGEKR